MNSDHVTEEVLKFLRSHPAFAGLVPADVGLQDSLTKSGVMDSVGIFHLIIFLEQKFNITVEVQEIVEDHFQNLKSIGDFVRQKTRAAVDAPIR